MKTRTRFRQALATLKEHVGEELARRFDIGEPFSVADIIETLVELSNAKATLRKALRLESVKPSYLAHLRREVAASDDDFCESVAMWCDIEGVSAAKFLPFVRKVKREIGKIVRGTLVPMTDTDARYLKSRPILCRDPLAEAVCYFVRRDPSAPNSVRSTVWPSDPPICTIPHTSYARKKQRRRKMKDKPVGQ